MYFLLNSVIWGHTKLTLFTQRKHFVALVLVLFNIGLSAQLHLFDPCLL